MLYRKTGYSLIRMERSSSIYGFAGDIQSQITVLPADDNVLDDSIEAPNNAGPSNRYRGQNVLLENHPTAINLLTESLTNSRNEKDVDDGVRDETRYRSLETMRGIRAWHSDSIRLRPIFR
ncbi:hypothetical protein IG631_20685 [Alternaria alternata]|nr:hypothetical protein IG631_20685 [Alternaria alternata]